MRTQANTFIQRLSGVAGQIVALAVALAWNPCPAVAQTAQEAATPVSTFEGGGVGVTDGSYKAGEYNGLQAKGGLFIGQFDFRGGGGYGQDNAFRWRATGIDLGFDTRKVSVQVGVQGKYRFTAAFDQLRRNRSDTYQTPFQGAGTNVLTLPVGWQVPTVAGSSGSNNVVNNRSARGLIPSIGTGLYLDTRSSSPTYGGVLTPTAAQIASVTAAAGADVPAFQNYDLSTKRTRGDVAFAYDFSPQWSVGAEFRPEHKDGAKPMGTVTRSAGGDISAVIPDVIDTNTNQFDVRLGFHGERGFAEAAYYGSTFRNNVSFISWQNWGSGPTGTGSLNLGTGDVNEMSSAPANNFNQISGSGGVTFSPKAKLVVNGSYGRSTQNDAFLTDETTPVVPVNSLNGLVVSEAFSARFTSKPARNVTVNAAYKFDNRDNRTAVHIYQYADAGEEAEVNGNFPAGGANTLGAVVAQNANANRPYSRKLNQFTADADFAITRWQAVKVNYGFERNHRECYSSWISCADAAITNEHSAGGEYRVTVAGQLTARASYVHAARRTPEYNENAFLALVPYANVVPVTSATGVSAYAFMTANGWNGFGPMAGYASTSGDMSLFFPSNNTLANALYANNNRISELVGMRRYYVADRDRNKVRTSLNWQATNGLSFQGNMDYTKERYTDAIYGLKDTSTWGANIDAMYSVSADLTFDLFYTYENLADSSAGRTYTNNSNASSISGSQAGVNRLSGNACDGYTTLQQRNNNNKIDPCLDWTSDRASKVNSVGVSLLARNVRDSRLDLNGNFVVSRERSTNDVTGGNWANSLLVGPGAAPTSVAAIFIAGAPLPTVSTNTYEVRVGGKYNLNSAQAVHIAYTYMRMKSADWMYEGMQFGSLSGVLPTNEQPFVYSVNVIGVSYVLSF